MRKLYRPESVSVRANTKRRLMAAASDLKISPGELIEQILQKDLYAPNDPALEMRFAPTPKRP